MPNSVQDTVSEALPIKIFIVINFNNVYQTS